MLAPVHQLLGQLNRLDDARISSAAADVTLHGSSDVGLAGMRILPQESNARHDHARRAVAALHRVSLNECLLHRMQMPILSDTFNCCDLLACDCGRASGARTHRRAIDEHRTSSAL